MLLSQWLVWLAFFAEVSFVVTNIRKLHSQKVTTRHLSCPHLPVGPVDLEGVVGEHEALVELVEAPGLEGLLPLPVVPQPHVVPVKRLPNATYIRPKV